MESDAGRGSRAGRGSEGKPRRSAGGEKSSAGYGRAASTGGPPSGVSSSGPQRGGRRPERPDRDAGSPDGRHPRQGSSSGQGAGSSARNSQRAGRDDLPARRGPRATRRQEGHSDPAVDEGITGRELDRAVVTQLRTLSKDNAKGVAAHLVMVGRLLDADPEAALAHADAAVRRAGRVAAVREARGMVAYRLGDFARALAEFRTARRLSGSSHLLALLVDCERALGRPARALELAASAQARTLDVEDRVELAIVLSGIRRDAGRYEAAAAELEIPQLHAASRSPWAARLRYAYAETQLGLGDTEAARRWFASAAEADEDLRTDAAERLEHLDGIRYTDVLGEDYDPDATSADAATGTEDASADAATAATTAEQGAPSKDNRPRKDCGHG